MWGLARAPGPFFIYEYKYDFSENVFFRSETKSQGRTGALLEKDTCTSCATNGYDHCNYGITTNPLRWVMPQPEGQGNGSIRNCLFRGPLMHGIARPSQIGNDAVRSFIGRSIVKGRGCARWRPLSDTRNSRDWAKWSGASRDYWCDFNYAYNASVTGPTFKASVSTAHFSTNTGPTTHFKASATAAMTTPTPTTFKASATAAIQIWQYDYAHWSRQYQFRFSPEECSMPPRV